MQESTVVVAHQIARSKIINASPLEDHRVPIGESVGEQSQPRWYDTSLYPEVLRTFARVYDATPKT
jgi:hypothetical protein